MPKIGRKGKEGSEGMGSYRAAIDLGTTTLELSLLKEDGSVAARRGIPNPESRFGSDVISRMTYLQKHPESRELLESVLLSFRTVLSEMLSGQEAAYPDDLSGIVVTANTVMASILLGLSTESLGRAPFHMPFVETREFDLDGIPVWVPAGASAFLGSDSCGGAWELPLKEKEILLDLGTNGEMLLCYNGKIHGASAACGPAFENCTRSMGIYGSTTLSVIADLIKRGKLSPDGNFMDSKSMDPNSEDMKFTDGRSMNPSSKDTKLTGGRSMDPSSGDTKKADGRSKDKYGGVSDRLEITPKILHEVQLASAAVYATFSMLLKCAGCPVKELRTVYLSGGFGFHMSLRDAGSLGILPEFLLDRVKVSGNTSLLAAERMVMDPKALSGYTAFLKDVITHRFAGDSEFETLFIDSMILKPRK